MHKQNITDVFSEWLNDPNKIDLFAEGTYKVNPDAKAAYTKALRALRELCLKGKCRLSIDNADDPYQIHAVVVEWKPNEYGDIELDETETALLIKGLTEMEMVFDEDNPLKWFICKKICSESE